MLFHCTVAIGYFVGPVIIGSFFPENEGKNQNDDICHGTNTKTENSEKAVNEVLENIKWAYWIMVIGHLFCALGYLFVLISPTTRMPGNKIHVKFLIDVFSIQDVCPFYVSDNLGLTLHFF